MIVVELEEVVSDDTASFYVGNNEIAIPLRCFSSPFCHSGLLQAVLNGVWLGSGQGLTGD